MNIYDFPPIAAVIDLAYGAVTAIATFLTPFAGTGATALAIVALTLLVRTALIPVGRSQVRAEVTRQRLAPKLRDLQKRYKKQPEVLQKKTMELYAAEKASPLAGCLPTLIQAPVVSVVYALFILAVINGHPNGLLTETLGGVPLGTSLVSFLGASGGQPWPGLAVYLVLLAVIAVVAGLQRHLTRLHTPAPVAADTTQQGMAQLTSWLSWMPFVTVVFAALVPLAATLYLATTTTWTLVERAVLRRILAPRPDGAPGTGPGADPGPAATPRAA